MPVMARPDALHHITIQRWWLCCVTILLSDCLACLRLRLYRALLHHRRSRSLGPRRELEHSRNRLPEREARHHADLRTRSPRSDLSARNGARQPALPGRRDNWFRSYVGGPPQPAHVAERAEQTRRRGSTDPVSETRFDLRALASVRWKGVT